MNAMKERMKLTPGSFRPWLKLKSIYILELLRPLLADSSDPCYDFVFRLEFGYPFPNLIIPPIIDSFMTGSGVEARLPEYTPGESAPAYFHPCRPWWPIGQGSSCLWAKKKHRSKRRSRLSTLFSQNFRSEMVYHIWDRH